MLITLGFFGAERPTLGEFGLQLVGGTRLVLLVVWAHRRGGLPLIDNRLSAHHDEEVGFSVHSCCVSDWRC